MEFIVSCIEQLLLALLVAPLLQGIIKSVKAKLQNRVGASPLQPYRDLRKYFMKEAVISEHASYLTRATPYICFALMLTASLMIPMIGFVTPLGALSDLLLIVYVFAVARFFTALTALDAASSFGGMCSARDMMLSAIAEPALLLAAVAVLLKVGTLRLGEAAAAIYNNPELILEPTYVLAFIAMIILLITETGRIPVDNPDTHLELTMIHEGMLLEYSGRYLGLMLWSAQIKQVLLYSIFISLFCPWGMSVSGGVAAFATAGLLFFLKLAAVGVLLAVIETLYAKMRLFQVPRLLGSSMVLSVLAIVITVVKG